MAIPSGITKKDILAAMQFIDENGVPARNVSNTYFLVSDSGKKYPPKYVIAVANHLSNNVEFPTAGYWYNAVEAKKFLEKLEFSVETKKEVETKEKAFEMTITASDVLSTDSRFTMNDLHLGNNYKPIDVYFENSEGEAIKRERNKGEWKNTNQTMPRLACQIFEHSLDELSDEEKKSFPVCQYTPKDKIIRGIFPSIEAFKKYKNSNEYVEYNYNTDKQMFIYCWNIFSTILFVKECLKRFGEEGDRFILVYREKNADEMVRLEESEGKKSEEYIPNLNNFQNPYSKMLIESKNIIFRGAPGTGKTYLAKEIAADIISEGEIREYKELSDEQKQQIEFVQFHPSYDYSDFVEGLRPIVNDDGSMGFELQDGVFKKFAMKAKKNFDDSQKTLESIEREESVQEIMSDYFSNIEIGVDELELARGNKFYITGVDEKYVHIVIPENKIKSTLRLNIEEIKQMLESEQTFTQVKDVTNFFGKRNATQDYSYDLAIFNAIKSQGKIRTETTVVKKELKPYIFIIDEINRGEISKIFGELFFSIDPGYRGLSGEISTQYANLHDKLDEKFFVPENVYIIGTMNDIDRSVDSFDFAMRRRFRFIEIKADEHLEMLDVLGEKKEEAVLRMSALNKEISKVEELNENYHVGAAYFLKLKTLCFDQLWTDCLHPLLQEYVKGMYNETKFMSDFAKAYGYKTTNVGVEDEATQD